MEGYDEDVIRKGTVLYNHLIKNNFQDFTVDETLPGKEKAVNEIKDDETLLNPLPEELHISANEKKMYKQLVEEILSIGLLLDEDYEILELCIPDVTTEPTKTRMFSRSDVFQVSYILFGSAIMWRFRNFLIQFIVLIPALGYLSYRMIEKYNQYTLQKDFKQFLITVRKLHQILKKIMRIIKDYSILTVKTDENTENNLKSSTLLSHFDQSTKSILFDIIVQYRQCIADTLQHLSPKLPTYFKNVYEFKPDVENKIVKLYFMYLLTQSQCLKMFGLMCCVQFWTTDTKAQMKLFHKNIIYKLNKSLQDAHAKATNTLTLFQNVENIKRPFLTSPIKIRQSQYDIYVNVYQMVLQLHSSLNRSWNIVSKFEIELNEDELKQMEREFDALMHEIKSLQEFVSICSIKLNKLQNSDSKEQQTLLNNESATVTPSTSKELKTADLKVIDLMNDDNSTAIDQIFELYIKRGDNVQPETVGSCSDNDNELRQDERKATKLVLKELEKVLVFKREEWNEREAKIRELQQQYHQNGENYDPTNSEPVSDESKRTITGPVQFRHKMKKSDSRQSESSSSEENRQHHDQQYFGPRSTAHILPHPRRISKYKSVRDKMATKPTKITAKLMPKNWESNESNDDSDINIPSHPIGFGNIQLPASISSFRQDEESLSAVGELSDSDSEIK